MLAVGLTTAGIVLATALTLRALQDNMMFFISVSEVIAGEYPEERNFRVGGFVVEDSLEIDGLDATFEVTDLRSRAFGPICFGKVRVWSPMAAWVTPAYSRLIRYWQNMMRTTWRRRLRNRSQRTLTSRQHRSLTTAQSVSRSDS
jgi:hypothetical protein